MESLLKTLVTVVPDVPTMAKELELKSDQQLDLPGIPKFDENDCATLPVDVVWEWYERINVPRRQLEDPWFFTPGKE